MKQTLPKHDLVLGPIFIALGILTRTSLHIGPNIEFVTALSLASGYFFYNKKLSWIVPFTIMVITDMVIGNTVIFLFTWSAFLIAPLIGILLKKLESKYSYLSTPVGPLASSIAFVLFFFLWTNFGVVVTTSMYTKDFAGLMHSYINALPFLKFQFVGNILIVPAVFYICKTFYSNSAPTAHSLI